MTLKPNKSLAGIFALFVFLFNISTFLFAQEPSNSSSDTTVVEEQGGVAESTDGIPDDDTTIAAGKSLFEENCATCHAVDKVVVGPALKDVHKRRDIPWIISFVKNSQQVIQSGDSYAVKLYEEYNKTQMTSFGFLTDEQIISILAYVKSYEPPVAQVAVTDGSPIAVSQNAIPSEYMTAILAAFIIVLILILIVLVFIIVVLTKILKDREDLDEADKDIINQKFDLTKVFKHKAFIGLVVIIFVALVAKTVVDGLFNVGVQQGYKPTQPIAFSHKLHAGQYEIDCNYCHTGVRKSKNANIPSLNICMNCHNQVKSGPMYGTAEIAKLIDAYENNKPVKWIRVHNLPDLAYFNHMQHVKVGEIECQTCHGPIEEMEEVQQFSRLTMGWCIDCHRKTDVKSKGNAYYDKLEELHKQHSKDPMKVEDIGGTECSKCHY